jgi:hypothetical protein
MATGLSAEDLAEKELRKLVTKDSSERLVAELKVGQNVYTSVEIEAMGREDLINQVTYLRKLAGQNTKVTTLVSTFTKAIPLTGTLPLPITPPPVDTTTILNMLMQFQLQAAEDRKASALQLADERKAIAFQMAEDKKAIALQISEDKKLAMQLASEKEKRLEERDRIAAEERKNEIALALEKERNLAEERKVALEERKNEIALALENESN